MRLLMIGPRACRPQRLSSWAMRTAKLRASEIRSRVAEIVSLVTELDSFTHLPLKAVCLNVRIYVHIYVCGMYTLSVYIIIFAVSTVYHKSYQI